MRIAGLEPARVAPLPPQSSVSANSTICARLNNKTVKQCEGKAISKGVSDFEGLGLGVLKVMLFLLGRVKTVTSSLLIFRSRQFFLKIHNFFYLYQKPAVHFGEIENVAAQTAAANLQRAQALPQTFLDLWTNRTNLSP